MAASGSGSYDAFLSYAREDLEAARAVRAALEERKVRVFLDDEIEPGQDWIGVLESTIAGGSAFLALVSEAARASRWVELETRLAVVLERSGKLAGIYPLWLSGDLEGFLAIYQALDLRSGVASSGFEAEMDELAAAIHKRLPPRFADTRVDDLAFLALFPQGVLKPVFESLARARGLDRSLSKTGIQAALVRRTIEGVEMVALSLPVLPAVSAALTPAGPLARQVLAQVEEALRLENPYGQEASPGPGLALLLRDELRLLEGQDEEDEDWMELRDEVVWRARKELPKLLAEEDLRLLALEILRALESVDLLDARERLTRAQLNLRLAAPSRALDLFDALGDSVLSEESLLTPEERIAAIQDWAKAAKDTGEGRDRHARLLEAYGVALDLVDRAYPAGRQQELVRADLLANRATQLTIFGDQQQDLAAAETDLASAADAYRRLEDAEHLLEVEAERLSLALHRLGKNAPPGADLLAEVARVEKLTQGVDRGAGLFFFYYMKGTILARDSSPAEAGVAFDTARRIAEHQRRDSRAALATWKVLRMRLASKAIALPEFLEKMEECRRRLQAAEGDAWAANALLKILIEDVQAVSLQLGLRDQALDATVEAFDRVHRGAIGRTSAALARVQRMKEEILRLEPDDAWGGRFVGQRQTALEQTMQLRKWEVTWEVFKGWQPGKE